LLCSLGRLCVDVCIAMMNEDTQQGISVRN
jgi:hypothetical protein